MKINFRPVLRALLYANFFGLCFLISLSLTFPSDALKARIIREAGKASDAKLEIKEFSAGLAGVSAAGISIVWPPEKPEGKPLPLVIDRLSIRPAALALFQGKLAVDIRLQTLGGELAAQVARGFGGKGVAVVLKDLDVSALAALAGMESISPKGKLSGQGQLVVADTVTNSAGSLDLNLQDAGLVRGQLLSLNLPALELGNITAKMQVKGTKLTIEQISAKSSDANLTITGAGEVNYRLWRSTSYNARVELKILDPFWSRNPHLAALRDMPMIKPYQRPDKSFGLILIGTFQRAPSFRPLR